MAAFVKWMAIVVCILGIAPLVSASVTVFKTCRRPLSGTMPAPVAREQAWKSWAVSLAVALMFVATTVVVWVMVPELGPDFVSSHEIFGAIWTIVIFILAAALVMGLLYMGYRRTSPGTLPKRALALALALCVVVLITLRVIEPEWQSRDWISTSILLSLIALIFAAEIAVRFPYRSARVWIERRFKPVVLWSAGALCLAGAGIAVMQLLNGRLDLKPFAFVYIGLLLIRVARRELSSQTRPLPKNAMNVDEMIVGALYLRSFGQEARTFAIVPVAAGGSLDMTAGSYSEDGRFLYARFDGFLRQEINGEIGPFVALGSPEDCAPPEGGAARLYATDSEWMVRFAVLAQRAICILMEVGDSGNLRRELAYLRREGYQEKLFILTSPELQGGEVTRAILDFFNPFLKSRKIGWSEFADDLSKLGYQLERDADPGPGSVVTFDRDGKAIVLAVGAVTPADFVRPIRARVGAEPGARRCLGTSNE